MKNIAKIILTIATAGVVASSAYVIRKNSQESKALTVGKGEK